MHSIGIRLITLAAISRVHSVWCAPWKVARPSGSVIWLVEVTAISGHRKLFQESRNVTANSAVRPRKRNRAKAYPASEHSTRLHSTVLTATIALFAKKWPNGALARASG